MQHVRQVSRSLSQEQYLSSSKSHSLQETYTGVIDLDDDDPIPVEIMLKYFYTGKYNEPINESEDPCIQLQVPVLTYNLADKYDVPTLMGLTEERFKITLGAGAATEEFLSVVTDVYNFPTSTNALRSVAVNYARKKFRGMMQSPDLEMLRATLRDLPEFAFDVLQLFVNTPLVGHCHSCGLKSGCRSTSGTLSQLRQGRDFTEILIKSLEDKGVRQGLCYRICDWVA
jgi:hypothetical protein